MSQTLFSFFEQPGWLGVLIPWLFFWLWFSFLQRRALTWIDRSVSPRFRPKLSRHSKGSLTRHLTRLLLMGTLLIVAAAGPRWPTTEVEGETEGGRVLLFLDGSASMYAEDVEALDGGEKPRRRFELARQLAQNLVLALPDYHFAVFTFSGITTLQVPLTKDRHTLEETLRVVEMHNFYRSSGSSLGGVLDTVLRYSDDSQNDLQAIILGDGEAPQGIAFDDPLLAVAESGIPVHTITMGSLEGENRVVYDFRDVVAQKDEPRTLREYTTRRIDTHLQRIASETGGAFQIADAQATELLRVAIERLSSRIRTSRPESWQDLTSAAFGLFLALMLFEFALHLRRPPTPPSFEVDRLGRRPKATATSLVLCISLVLIVAWGCNDRLTRAHRENERGIARDENGLHPIAQVHYRRSRKARINTQIPTYNQARSATMAGDLAAAHDLYQEALLLDPDLAEAYFNDGITLYLWGEAERDPKGCELERTLELWQTAVSRFTTATNLRSSSPALLEDSHANQESLEKNIETLQGWIAHPPADCKSAGAADTAEENKDPNNNADEGNGSENSNDADEDDENDENKDPSNDADEGNGSEDNNDADEDDEGNEDSNGADQNGEDQGSPSGSEPSPEGPENTSGSENPGSRQSAQDHQQSESEPKRGSVTPEEIEEIRAALERIGAQAQSDGSYHRRARSEQFPKSSWENPESDIWW